MVGWYHGEWPFYNRSEWWAEWRAGGSDGVVVLPESARVASRSEGDGRDGDACHAFRAPSRVAGLTALTQAASSGTGGARRATQPTHEHRRLSSPTDEEHYAPNILNGGAGSAALLSALASALP